jgi:uncharacterized protein YybS (DUF2232 family)
MTLADTRDGILLTLACMFGAIIAPALPVVGFPVCAASLVGLLYRHRPVVMTVAAAAALAVTALLWWTDVLIVGPALLAVVIAARRMPRADAVNVAVALVPVFALGFAASELAKAWMLDLSVREYLTRAVEQLDAVLVAGGAQAIAGTEDLVDTMLRFAPAGYFLMSVATVVPTLAAMAWAARRSGVELPNVRRLSTLDLTPHVLWTLVGALALVVVGRYTGQTEGWVSSVGINLLIVAKVVLFTQGLGVLSAALGVAGVGKVGRAFAYVIALLIEGPTWLLSIVGLLDFWANFRKLDRDGSGQAANEGPVT